MYDDMMANYIGTTIRPWHTQPHCAAVIDTFICPSDSEGEYSRGRGTGPTSYHCNRGDYWLGWNWYECRGVFGTGYRGGSRRTIHSFSSIKDGSSNTMLLAECKIGMQGTKEVGIAFGTGAGAYNGAPPSLCLALVGPDNKFSGNVETGGWQIGWRWADSMTPYTSFHPMLPPNGPSCGNRGEDWAIVTAGSYHPGGCNVALVDGSVRFISETIDAGDPTMTVQQMPDWGGGSPQAYSGASPYGVWGALGTSYGGEQVTLP
jgi:prepilin-type processing-associated H-X9-DG protein